MLSEFFVGLFGQVVCVDSRTKQHPMERRDKKSHWTFGQAAITTDTQIYTKCFPIDTHCRIMSFILAAMTASNVSIHISPSPVGE